MCCLFSAVVCLLILDINSWAGRLNCSQQGQSSSWRGSSSASWASRREGMKPPLKYLGWAVHVCKDEWLPRWGPDQKEGARKQKEGWKGMFKIKLQHLSSGLAPVCGRNVMKDVLIYVSLGYVGLDPPECFWGWERQRGEKKDPNYFALRLFSLKIVWSKINIVF